MDSRPIIVFVCEHGAAKSIIAAAYFNKLAQQRGMTWSAIARGTNPDLELSEATRSGLAKDGLTPTEVTPQELSADEIESAQRIVSFCELPKEFEGKRISERWDGVPAVSENYERARDAIIERIQNLLNRLAA